MFILVFEGMILIDCAGFFGALFGSASLIYSNNKNSVTRVEQNYDCITDFKLNRNVQFTTTEMDSHKRRGGTAMVFCWLKILKYIVILPRYFEAQGGDGCRDSTGGTKFPFPSDRLEDRATPENEYPAISFLWIAQAKKK